MAVCLGIESTAHTIGVGICESAAGGAGIKVLANARRLYKPPAGQGIIPRVAADHHAEFLAPVLREALSDAGVSLSGIDLFASR